MIMEQQLVKIGVAAEMLGTKLDTLRARLYGSRSYKSKKILDALTDDEKKETAKQLSIL